MDDAHGRRRYEIHTIIMFHRREAGMCRICWSADEAEDVGVTGATNAAATVVSVSDM